MSKAGNRLIKAAQEALRIVQERREAIEDMRLNALADERAKGPFVRVSLDDL